MLPRSRAKHRPRKCFATGPRWCSSEGGPQPLTLSGPHPLTPSPFRRGGTKIEVSCPLSRRERGTGGEDLRRRRGRGVKTSALPFRRRAKQNFATEWSAHDEQT